MKVKGEHAWDADGKYTGGGTWAGNTLPHLAGKHQHPLYQHQELLPCGSFLCKKCRRRMPDCCGATDAQCCDDCWARRRERHARGEEVK